MELCVCSSLGLSRYYAAFLVLMEIMIWCRKPTKAKKQKQGSSNFPQRHFDQRNISMGYGDGNVLEWTK